MTAPIQPAPGAFPENPAPAPTVNWLSWGKWIHNAVNYGGFGDTLIQKGVSVYKRYHGFDEKSIQARTDDNIRRLEELTGSRFYEAIVQKLTEFTVEKLESEESFGFLIKAEKGDIRPIANALAIQMVRNWAECAHQRNPESEDLTLDMILILTDTGKNFIQIPSSQNPQEFIEPFAAKIMSIFLPNGASDIPVPSSLQEMVYELIYKNLKSVDVLGFNTSIDRETLDSPVGRHLLEWIGWSSKFLEPEALQTLASNQAHIAPLIEGSFPGKENAAIREWISTRYQGAVKSKAFDEIIQASWSLIDLTLTKIVISIIKENKTDMIAAHFRLFIATHIESLIALEEMEEEEKESRAVAIFTDFTDQLLWDLGVEDGKNLPFPGILKDIAVPMLKNILPTFIASNYIKQGEGFFALEKQREHLASQVGPNGSNVAHQLAELTAKTTTSLMHQNPGEFTKTSPREDLPFDPEAWANVLRGIATPASGSRISIEEGTTHYLETVYMQAIQNFQEKLKEKEKDPAFTSHLISHLIDHAIGYGSKTDHEIPYDALTTDILASVGFTKESLPVPQGLKEPVWKMLNEDIVPNTLKSLVKEFLDPAFVEAKLIETLQNPFPEQSAETSKESKLPSIRLAESCTRAVPALVKAMDLGLARHFINENASEQIGLAIATAIEKTFSDVPLSKMVELALKKTADENLLLQPAPPLTAPKPGDLPKVISRLIKDNITLTARKGWPASFLHRFGSRVLRAMRVDDQNRLAKILSKVGFVVWYIFSWIPSMLISRPIAWYIDRKTHQAVSSLRKNIQRDLVTDLTHELFQKLNAPISKKAASG